MDDAHADEPLAFLGTPLPSWVHRQDFVIESGASRPYDESEWRDALVVVDAGAVTLECVRGGFNTFHRGDVMWLVDIPLRWMHNWGAEPVVVVAISRRRPHPKLPSTRHRTDSPDPTPRQTATPEPTPEHREERHP